MCWRSLVRAAILSCKHVGLPLSHVWCAFHCGCSRSPHKHTSSMPPFRVPKYTAGLADLPHGTAVPTTLEALGDLVQRMSFAVVSEPLAPALQGRRVVRGQYGLASRRMMPPALSRDSQRAPNFTRILFQFLSQRFPNAVVSSCTIAFHRSAPLHVDSSNMGLSYAAAIKSEAGGDLWTALPYTVHGAVLRVTQELCEFDSLVMRTTLPLEGPRYYISFYCHRSVARTSAAVRSRLVELNIPLPTAAECSAMLLKARQKPPLCQRKADGTKQWDAYLRTLHPDQRSAAIACQQRKGGSWICARCRVFGPLALFGGNPRTFCSRACENKLKRSILKKTNQQKTPQCRNCGRSYTQRSKPGGQLRYCQACRRIRVVTSTVGS